jgi:hypothetical protein
MIEVAGQLPGPAAPPLHPCDEDLDGLVRFVQPGGRDGTLPGARVATGGQQPVEFGPSSRGMDGVTRISYVLENALGYGG